VTSLAINNCPITGFEHWLVDLALLFTFPASYDSWFCVINMKFGFLELFVAMSLFKIKTHYIF